MAPGVRAGSKRSLAGLLGPSKTGVRVWLLFFAEKRKIALALRMGDLHVFEAVWVEANKQCG